MFTNAAVKLHACKWYSLPLAAVIRQKKENRIEHTLIEGRGSVE
jgi:hypothetical protein